MRKHDSEFHGYVGQLAVLKDCDYRSGKILGGDGYTLYMQAIDGNVFQCYHNNIDFIWDK
jgi:hypothetical protein|tara:strand:- start:335 stop:514 length:180 start_codon:yes stop_codon:yes gene_type:complete